MLAARPLTRPATPHPSQEHAYYGSFGYHVTNFFGVSSRCGTPDELKAMIDEAHRWAFLTLPPPSPRTGSCWGDAGPAACLAATCCCCC